jgi:hypothetical protein
MTVLANGNKLPLLLTVLINVIILKGKIRILIEMFYMVNVCRPPVLALRLVNLTFTLVPLEDIASLPAPLWCVVERIMLFHAARGMAAPCVGAHMSCLFGCPFTSLLFDNVAKERRCSQRRSCRW